LSPSTGAVVPAAPSPPDAGTGQSVTRTVSIGGASHETLAAAGSLPTGGLPGDAADSVSRRVGAVSAALAPVAIAAQQLVAAATQPAAAAQQVAPTATAPAAPAAAPPAVAQPLTAASTPTVPGP
jgi:hypothetical protein